MYKNFYIPQLYEGWDDIKIIWNNRVWNLYMITELLERLKQIDQENSHHTLTIGDHCIKTLNIIETKSNDINLSFAALLHDIGKDFTKSFRNAKGETTPEAHYYQHHLVSAYNSLFYLKYLEHSSFDLLKVLALITWHMQPFFIKTDKSKKQIYQSCWTGIL